MQLIFDSVLDADRIVLTTPIYCWFCTAPMKAALDRLMYGMNKYYGEEKGPSIWVGKHVSIVTTCGYKPEKGADVFEEGIKRYCKHSSLIYDGMYAKRDLGYKSTFMDKETLFFYDMFEPILRTLSPLKYVSKTSVSQSSSREQLMISLSIIKKSADLPSVMLPVSFSRESCMAQFIV